MWSIVKVPSMGLIGVCALDVKARSKASRNILTRLQSNELEVVVFGDKVILDEGERGLPSESVVAKFVGLRCGELAHMVSP